MDQFEKIIIQHRDQIQNDLPDDGHWELFDLKLNRAKAKKNPWRWIAFSSSIAAALVLAILIIVPDQSRSNTFTLSDVSAQYADVEFYYTNSINNQIDKIKHMAVENGKTNPSIQLLLDDLEAYDVNYKQLCADLESTPNNEHIINALIVYYQSKLEIITRILKELDNQKKTIEEYENTKD
ncbi:MAG: hypothetical protein ACERKD_08290 [Prolixibacteraceae bacterium]